MNHPHGTDRSYIHYKCRCDQCRQAHNEAARVRRRQQAYGTYQKSKRNTLKTRDHLHKLTTAGITLTKIHELTGISMHTLGRITLGKTTTIQAETETRILALQPNPNHVSPHTPTNPTGTARRLQALQYNGWTQTQIANMLGSQVAHIWKLTHQKTGASKQTADKIQDLYNQIWNTRPAPYTKYNTLAANIARRHGWLPPLAWDDDLIDHPAHHGHPQEIAA